MGAVRRGQARGCVANGIALRSRKCCQLQPLEVLEISASGAPSPHRHCHHAARMAMHKMMMTRVALHKMMMLRVSLSD